MTRRAELVATSRADDLSLRALADVAHITVDDSARVVGGRSRVVGPAGKLHVIAGGRTWPSSRSRPRWPRSCCRRCRCEFFV
jgi:hypothetical protein